jgi:hypothetical protein
MMMSLTGYLNYVHPTPEVLFILKGDKKHSCEYCIILYDTFYSLSITMAETLKNAPIEKKETKESEETL